MTDPEQFRKALDAHYDWPATYTFRFIVPRAALAAVEKHFPDGEVEVRASSKGNYLRLRIHEEMRSSDAVLQRYRKLEGIRGLISL